MAQKKILLLGGVRYLVPVIKTAHEFGMHVITADYLPSNVAHKYSDEYVNVSILDREAVLKVAREKKIDGIMSFGVDPGVEVAAWVSEKLRLPSPPYESVHILQNKDLFRDFLQANGFNCPIHRSYVNKCTAISEEFDYPVIVKPVDSAGSKGVTRVDSSKCLPAAIDVAIGESHSGRFIIEKFLELGGRQTGSDCFCVNNQLVFPSFGSQYFDSSAANGYAPVANTWPAILPDRVQAELSAELQRLVHLLNLGTTILNVEARVAVDGKPYIMEVSPRGGGNCISEVLRLATGQDLIRESVKASLGMLSAGNSSLTSPCYNGFWAYYVIHATRDGYLKSVSIDKEFAKKHVMHKELMVSPMSRVSAFRGANCALGFLFLRFDTHEDLDAALTNPDAWICVEVV